MGYTQLDAAARAFGLPPPGACLGLRYQGLVVTTTLKISSGSVIGFTLEAHAALPELELSVETEGDRRGKRLGISREIQTGDRAFDDRVYVDSDEPDARVARALASAEVRAAALELLATFGAVHTGPTGVTLEARGEYRSLLEPERFERLLAAVHALVSGIAAADREGAASAYRDAAPVRAPVASPRRPFLTSRLHRVLVVSPALSLLGTVVLLTSMAYSQWWRPVAGGSMVALGLAAGAALGALLVPVLALLIRGRSSSYRRFVFLAILLGATLVALGPGALVAINARADRSPAAEHVVPIDAVESKSDDDSKSTTVEVHAAWRPSRERLTFDLDGEHPELRAGVRWHVVSRAGALGWEWIERCTYEAAPR